MFDTRTKILLVLLGVCSSVAEAQLDQRAQIVLPSQVAVTRYDVQLGDVADIRCSNSILRQKLEQINIAQIPTGKSSTQIRPSFLKIRLQLAGIDPSRFVIDGAKACGVEYTEPPLLTDAAVEQAGAIAFQEMLGGSIKDIRVRLNAPFVSGLPAGTRERRGLRAIVLPPARSKLGVVSASVQLWDGKSLLMNRLTRFEVMQRQTVAITLASFSRDQPIDLNNLKLEERFVSESKDQPIEKDLRGKIARRDIGPGQVLSLKDLKVASSSTRQRIVVKARDIVQVVAKAGRLRVRLPAAVAMQSGSVGDTIQFRNPASGMIKSGVITGPGKIEVQN